MFRYDSDILFSTNNTVLKRRYKTLPAIECIQRNAEKTLIKESDVKKTNKNGLGNDVGIITNYVTSMMEVQSRFPKDSDEYKELEYRIECGQLFQQNSLDKIKGIISKPMPSCWYNRSACGDDTFLQSICADKKPYFMIYIYPKVKKTYKTYIKEHDTKCQRLYNCSVEELYLQDNLTDEQKDFLFWYEYNMPVGLGNCSMNKICRHIEKEFVNYKTQLHKTSDFNYEILKVKRRCTNEHREQLLELAELYRITSKNYSVKYNLSEISEAIDTRQTIKNKIKFMAKEICPNDEERLNIVLDMAYKYGKSHYFCWNVIGDLIVNRLIELRESEDLTALMYILDEEKYITNILNTMKKPDDMSNSYLITLLTKYYYMLGYRYSDLEQKIKETLLKFDLYKYQEYKYHSKIVSTICDVDTSAMLDKPLFKKLDYIPIYQAEIDIINDLQNDHYKKLMFTLCVIARYMDCNGWINKKDNKGMVELFKLANVHCSSKDKNYMIYELHRMDLINFTKKNINNNIQVNLIPEGNIVYKLTDFENIGNQFISNFKDGYSSCKNCGKIFKKKSNSNTYCRSCSTKLGAIRQKKYREKKSESILK